MGSLAHHPRVVLVGGIPHLARAAVGGGAVRSFRQSVHCCCLWWCWGMSPDPSSSSSPGFVVASPRVCGGLVGCGACVCVCEVAHQHKTHTTHTTHHTNKTNHQQTTTVLAFQWCRTKRPGAAAGGGGGGVPPSRLPPFPARPRVQEGTPDRQTDKGWSRLRYALVIRKSPGDCLRRVLNLVIDDTESLYGAYDAESLGRCLRRRVAFFLASVVGLVLVRNGEWPAWNRCRAGESDCLIETQLRDGTGRPLPRGDFCPVL